LRRLILVSIFFCACFLRAQSPAPALPSVASDPASVAFRQMELFTRSVREANEDRARHTSEKRAEQYARLQFWQKANKFVALWEDFAARINENQTVDAKLAKRLSKAFHELESSDGWPVRTISANPTGENK
jgi:hypothetical protein